MGSAARAVTPRPIILYKFKMHTLSKLTSCARHSAHSVPRAAKLRARLPPRRRRPPPLSVRAEKDPALFCSIKQKIE